MRRDEMKWNGMTWHDMAWHDMAWHDMTWHNMTWHDMACHDTTWKWLLGSLYQQPTNQLRDLPPTLRSLTRLSSWQGSGAPFPALWALSSHVISFMSFHFISYHLIASHSGASHLTSYHFIASHIISSHLISYHLISFHLISSHPISFHLMSCQFMSQARLATRKLAHTPMYDERFARQHRYEPPSEFPLNLPFTSIVHHLSGPNRRAHNQTSLSWLVCCWHKDPSSQFRFESRVNHPWTCIYVRLLGPCFNTGRTKPFNKRLDFEIGVGGPVGRP